MFSLLLASTLLPVEPVEQPPKFGTTVAVSIEAKPKFAPSAVTFTPAQVEYSNVISKVQSGQRVTYVSTGEVAPAGTYECWLENDVPVMRRIDTVATPVATVPQVTVPQVRATIPGGDHNCPNCGTVQTRQSGRGIGGSHSHTCPSCNTTWSHGGQLGYPGTRSR